MPSRKDGWFHKGSISCWSPKSFRIKRCSYLRCCSFPYPKILPHPFDLKTANSAPSLHSIVSVSFFLHFALTAFTPHLFPRFVLWIFDCFLFWVLEIEIEIWCFCFQNLILWFLGARVCSTIVLVIIPWGDFLGAALFLAATSLQALPAQQYVAVSKSWNLVVNAGGAQSSLPMPNAHLSVNVTCHCCALPCLPFTSFLQGASPKFRAQIPCQATNWHGKTA